MFIAIVTAVTTVLAVPYSAAAAEYEDSLRAKGFPESYVQKLSALHQKYPNWIFEPLMTNLDWQAAVDGERASHSNQLIQNVSLYDSSMFCQCPSCYVNGNYIVREGTNWVSASETAVKYYMDPRNWLDEKYIFQFESTSYDGTQTKEGVEAILDGTWMHDSLITYKTTGGSDKLYDNTTKYSDVIMKAAGDSGMSAYYLASKIRQENGGATASASAVSGVISPFQGIYNYYNIGAYSGASDGLAWAAGFLKTNKATVMYSDYDAATASPTGTAVALPADQYMTWRANKGNYYYVRLYTESGGKYIEGASGYVLKSDCRTAYLGDTATGLGRPWTNPYKAIYYGAKYIARGFSTQTSGYLQKFNVNPASSQLHTNEYMKNVAAASSEALTTHSGYEKAGILPVTKTFVIPVYINMPEELGISGLTAALNDDSSALISWNAAAGASGYQVQMNVSGQWIDIANTNLNYTYAYNLEPKRTYVFRARAYVNNGASVTYGTFSEISLSTAIGNVSGITSSSGNNYVKLSWLPAQNATGYYIYIYSTNKKTYRVYATADGGNTTSVKLSGLKPNKSYKFKIKPYRAYNGTAYKGSASAAVSVKTKNNVVTLSSAKSSKTKRIAVRWQKVSGVTGYEVMWSTSGNFKKNFLSVRVKGASKKSTTLKTAKSKKTYYVRVRAYKTSKGKTTYYPWSKTIKLKVK